MMNREIEYPWGEWVPVAPFEEICPFCEQVNERTIISMAPFLCDDCGEVILPCAICPTHDRDKRGWSCIACPLMGYLNREEMG